MTCVRKDANILLVPPTTLLIYREANGEVPLMDWLDAVPPKVRVKCRLRLERLRSLGYELRRPEADLLRDGIYELRVGHQGVNYRILYFFHGAVAVVATGGFTKEKIVPPVEIDRAVRRRQLFTTNPDKHAVEY